jgi:hypothetical protein
MVRIYELSQLNHLDSILERETNINNLVSIRAQIAALHTYAVNIGKSKEECKEIAMARIRSERRAGQVLLSLPKANGNRPGDVGLNELTPLIKDTIGKSNSHRWQTIAQLPNDKFENLALGCIQDKEQDVTTHYFYKAARVHTGRTNSEYQHTPDTIAVLARKHLDTDGIARLVAILNDSMKG